ncbi:hypothetical protein H1R20_g10524, partial [Candolleomyces eurysporus]
MSTVTLFDSAINSKTKKDYLVVVAEALKIDAQGTNKAVAARITAHLKAHSELAQDPQFQGLFSGRANNPNGGVSKTSADKAEDDRQAEKTKTALTGAHKVLLDVKYTTDPAPSFALLNQGAHGDADMKEIGDLAAKGEEDSDDGSSLPSVESPKEHLERDHTPDHKAAPKVIKNPINPARLPPSLKIDALNKYPLEKTGENMFACRLFWKEVDEDKTGEVSCSVQSSIHPFSSSSSHLPPLIRAQKAAAIKKEEHIGAEFDSQESKLGFYSFLREFLALKIQDLHLERAVTMKTVVVRYNLLEDSRKKLQSWTRPSSTGGYQVPYSPNFGDFCGHQFTRQDLLSALGFKTMRAGTDLNLINRVLSMSKEAPKAFNWVQNLDSSPYAEQFEGMLKAKFIEYLNRKAEAAKGGRGGSSKDPISLMSEDEDSEGGRKDRRRRRRDTNDTDHNTRGGKRSKGKGYNSDDMDSL